MSLSKKDKQLIQGFAKKDNEATRNFLNKYKKLVFGIALNYVKKSETAEELAQEILSKIFKLFQNPDNYKSIKILDAWITTIAKNYCIDYFNKAEQSVLSKTEAKSDQLPDKNEQTRPEEIFIKKETPHIIKYEEKISSKIRDDIEISLEWIEKLYKLKEKVKREYKPVLKTLEILLDTKEDIKYILGPLKKEEDKKYIYPNPAKMRIECRIDILKIARFNAELDPEALKKFKVAIHYGLYSLIEGTRKIINANPAFNELLGPGWFSSVLKDPPFPQEILVYLLKMRIKPYKLMFLVLRKALKRGIKYTNLEDIETALLGLKEKTKGTEKELLFSSLTDSININSLRKSIYSKSKNKEIYEKLAEFIYRKSFVEKKKPESIQS